MLRLFRNKNDVGDIVLSEKENYVEILDNLTSYLKMSNNNGQAAVVEKLDELIRQNDTKSFLELISSVNMWGGSGAVWEVYIRDSEMKWKFEREIIRLVNLMEKNGISSFRIRQTRALFLKSK